MQKIEPVPYLIQAYGRDARFVFMPNGGNLGDNLIAAATIQQFNQHGLKWTLMEGGKENLRSGDVLVYGGGGSLVGLYKGGIACLEFLSRMGTPIVVLPQTVRSHENFWTQSKNITVFCRDVESHRYLGGFSHVQAHLADDMAIGLDLETAEYKPVLEYRLRLNRAGLLGDTLNVFRADEEGSTNCSRLDSIDLSDIAYPNMRSVADIQSMAVLFLMGVAPFRTVNTDRLHVTVAAALLGAETRMHDNNYGKNRGVFEFSLQQKFANVTLVR